MPAQDTSKIKEKIMSIIRIRGPCIPSNIATEIQNSILFTSVFLSELLSEKKLKISNMKVGNSPIYFIPGQEPQLEKFGQEHLKSREKDAFFLLKEKNFLNDINQEPAIRVALRSIKDFAIPFKKNDEIFWRYFKIQENEFQQEKEEKPLLKESQDNISKLISRHEVSAISQGQEGEETTEEKPLDIFSKEESKEKTEKPKSEAKKSLTQKKKSIKKKTTQKANEKFFNKIKEYLAKSQIEISDIIGFSKNDLILKILEDNKEKLLIAYNKRSVREDDILKAHKKASELNLPYLILSLGEPLKKLTNLIEAIQKLDKIEKIKE